MIKKITLGCIIISVILCIIFVVWRTSPEKYYILKDVDSVEGANWFLVISPPNIQNNAHVKILDNPAVFNEYKDKVYRYRPFFEYRMDYNINEAAINCYQDGKWIGQGSYWVDDGVQFAGMDKYFKNAVDHKVKDSDRAKVANIYAEAKKNKKNYVLSPYNLDEKYDGYFKIYTQVDGDENCFSTCGESTRAIVEKEFSSLYNFKNMETEQAHFTAQLNGFNSTEAGWIITVKSTKAYYLKFDKDLLYKSKVLHKSSIEDFYSDNEYGFEYFSLVN